MNTKLSPCYDCKDRSAECHATCKSYLEWAEARSKKSVIIRKEKELDSVVTGYTVSVIRRNHTHRNR